MKRMLSTALLALLCTFGLYAHESSYPFFDGSFEQMKVKARQLQKPYLLYLSLENCVDCDKMDRSSFQNRALLAYLEQHFFAFKLEIDPNDNRSLDFARSYVPAQIFPAILIFDAQDELQFLEAGFLTSQYILRNLQLVQEGNEVPLLQANPADYYDAVHIENGPPPIFSTEEIAQPKRILPTYKHETPASAQAVSKRKSTHYSHIEFYRPSLRSGYIRLEAQNLPFTKWAIQVGAFSQRHSLDKAIAELYRYGHVHAFVHQEASRDQTLYRLLIGPFPNAETAHSYKRRLRYSQWEKGFVRSLGEYK